MMNFRNLNPNDFKKWMKQHDAEQTDKAAIAVGSIVEAKYCGKKTARNIVLESGKAGRVVREFVQNGGTVKSVEGDEYLVEVDSGSFYINKRNIIS